MIKVLAIHLLMFGLSVQLCDKGCLKCNSKDECIFCDVSNNYYLSGANCTVSNSTNCLVLNLNGDCGQCQPGYYLDPATKKCVAVGSTQEVANCTYYGTRLTCVRCAKNNYINSGRCIAVTNLIENCDSYSDDGKCSGCSSGFIFNSTRNGCIPSPSSANCASYSHLDCKSCASGYILNQNLYLANYQADSNLLFSDIQKSLANSVANNWSALNRCQQILVQNCLITNAYNVCTKCNDGYFLHTDGLCYAYPLPSIAACQTYSSLVACSACNDRYYLETSAKCTYITDDKLIANCTAYNNTAASVQCTQCSTTKYLANNACASDRVDSLNIINCKTVTVNEDSCAVCNDGYVLTNDRKKCLALIQNCKQYASSDLSATALNCKTCSDKYYLNQTDTVSLCIAGNIEGCLSYSSSTICAACDPAAYYLSDNKCSKHVPIANCVTYSSLNFNECVTCATGFYPFKLATKCSSITVITNCVQFSDASTCAKCASGYFLLKNKCIATELAFSNCDVAQNEEINCKQCSDGYAMKSLSNDKSCAPNHNYILDQCESVGSDIRFKTNDGVDYDSCLVCKENSIPFDLSGLFSCISDSLLNTRGISAPVASCKQYSNDASPLCLKCDGYLNIPTSGSRTCTASCNLVINTNIQDNLDGNINTCVRNTVDGTYSLAGCSSAIKVYDSTSKLTCLKYANYKAYVSLTSPVLNNPSYWRDIDDSSVPRPDGAFLYFGFSVANSLRTDTDAHQNEGDTNKNCELYWKTNNVLYCYRCKWSYAVKHYIPTGESALKTRCFKIDGCDTTVSYSGFSAQLNQVLSCHRCTNNQFVTVIVGTAVDNTSFSVSSLVRDKLTVQCLPVETNANIAATEAKPRAVDGCLIYGWIFLNTNPASPVAPTNARGCLACQPGYKLSGNFGTCSPIVNCDSTKTLMANRCTACTQVGNSGQPELKAFRTYLADECVLVKSDNCLFADSSADGDNKYTCTACKPGYWLNFDNICEKITLPQCNDASGSTNIVSLPNLNSSSSVGVYYILKYLSKASSITGCDTCKPTFTPVRMNSGEEQCVASSYVQANSFNSSSNKYIPDCAKYHNIINKQINPVSFCNTCKNGKIPTDLGTKCVNSITNCLVALNSDNTKCYTCANTHVSVSGSCVLKTISNCVIYDTSPTVTDLLCVECSDGFVLSSSKKTCYRGNVYGCKSYGLNLPWVCNTCFDGFMILSLANSKTYCLKINDGSNCQSLSTSSSSGLQAGYYKCDICSATNNAAYIPALYSTSDNTLPQTICMSLNLVDKCVSYDSSQTSIASNTFLCTACAAGYYLDESKNACLARTVLPSGCIDYYFNKDKCKVCIPSTFKNDAENACVSFPTGIPGCATYSNNATCTSCNPPGYLRNNTCSLSTVINKCANYTDNYTCTKCERGYFLENSTSCAATSASDCYIASSNTTCQSCDPNNNGKGLKTDDSGVTSCVDKNVQNCDYSTDKYPFSCVRCKSGFYLGTDGNCTAVNTTIFKCSNYDGGNTCSSCEKGSVLGVDKLSCNDTFFNGYNDANCADSQLLANPVCSKCKFGYIFTNGICTPCSKNSYDTGCLSCDPVNQTNCLACLPGYYQSANGTCIQLFTGIKFTKNSTTTVKSAVFMNIYRYLVLIIALFMSHI